MKNNPELKKNLRIILECCIGQHKAVTATELAHRLQLTGNDADRRVRLIILDLIWEGLPILATPKTPGGFYLAGSWDEWREYDEQMKSRIAESAKRRMQVKRNVHAYFEGAVKVRMI